MYEREGKLLTHLFNAVFKQITIDKWTKGCVLHFPKKGDLGITKSFGGMTLTAIAAKVYNVLLLNRIKLEIEKFIGKSERLSKKSNHNFTDSGNTPNQWRGMCKNSRGNTIVLRFLQNIWFYKQREDGLNTTTIYSSQRNC